MQKKHNKQKKNQKDTIKETKVLFIGVGFWCSLVVPEIKRI